MKLDSLDDVVEIRIKPKNNHDCKEETVLNLFLIIKQKYGMIFNDTIHNHTEIVNIPLIEELKKINGNQINGNKINIQLLEKNDKKCPHFFKIFNELKNYFGLNKNCVLEENDSIIELITYPGYSETKVDDYKSKLDNIFKE